LDAVEEMDLSAFYGAYRKDGWGRAAFEPAMMVALLLYAYAIGERSSRRIERCCREDVAFRVIAANRLPDHATIARFRARHEQALADTFTQVLALCARAGLVSVGLVALDGSLLSGSASPGATRTYASIRKEVEAMLEQAAQADATEDVQFGRRVTMSCLRRLLSAARVSNGFAAAARNSSGRRPALRPPTRRTLPGGRSGRPSMAASSPGANRHPRIASRWRSDG
jgi:transposase